MRRLADEMLEPDSLDPAGDNDSIPAGYVYLGQFIDHDITFDPTSSLQRANDPEALVSFRSPRFDLDSLYGRGPADDPYLYDQASPGGAKLLIGRVREMRDVQVQGEAIPRRMAVPTGEHDLPRNDQHRALIGDPRNDEN